MKGWNGINKRCWARKRGKTVGKKEKRRAEKVERKIWRRGKQAADHHCKEKEGCAQLHSERRPRVESHLKNPATHTYILVDTSQSLAHAIEQATCISASLNSNPVGLLTRTYFSLLW